MTAINVDDDTARALAAQAKARNVTLERYLHMLAVRESGHSPASVDELPTPEERAAAWRAWVASHKPVTHFVDDSRESIYDGCGE